MIQINEGKYFRARQKARLRQPSGGLPGFWGRGTCWDTPRVHCHAGREGGMGDPPRSLWDRTWPASSTTSAKSATSPGLRGGGLAAHLHSSLCVPMISSRPCSRPWDRRLCLTLQMRKWGSRKLMPCPDGHLARAQASTLVGPRLQWDKWEMAMEATSHCPVGLKKPP